MPRWRALPEELDPQVREFASQLRRLVDRSGLSIAAVADRTGYSKTSWERYLGGRLLAPKGAVVALAEVTGTNPAHLTTMWELAERAWSRSEMRHDMTMEAIRISQARAALGEFGSAGAGAGTAGGARNGRAGAAGHAAAPRAGGGSARGAADGGTGRGPAAPQGHGRQDQPARRREPAPGKPKRKATMFLAGLVGALLVIAAAVLLTDLGGDGDGGKVAEKPTVTPTTSAPALPAGVKCTGADCTGKDPEVMGCGGTLATTTAKATVGTALVEVRYSKTCGAAWARITQATPGDTVRITSGGSAAQNGTVNADRDAYTPMTAAAEATEAKACATLTTGVKGCTEEQ
ncbi:XRE family transcriptional regulator [Streptomyces sp. A3M-1-3]|uniref:helix-turn-helix domain-containing protein n=1 Tax=Streptomyces sp. A3M-1-3 TaxID=2962044 RepID=UPI0020B7F8F0|nr:XRE family transcriptional regulator [Streptomyces sp. A3M-1-3]MCP3818883.1 XRE family transcriptional regulator [Streptomyces sp. A3M-1-3]